MAIVYVFWLAWPLPPSHDTDIASPHILPFPQFSFYYTLTGSVFKSLNFWKISTHYQRKSIFAGALERYLKGKQIIQNWIMYIKSKLPMYNVLIEVKCQASYEEVVGEQK